ncbi:MAG: hypothetical protein ACFFFO_07495 [Candidatus Thorarchaeota archaeon]
MAPSNERFRPIVNRTDTSTTIIAKILVVSLLLFMFIAPMTRSYDPIQVVSTEDNTSSLAQEGPLYHHSLPGTSIPIAVGEISGYRGFAYVIESESRLYFVDLIQEVTLDIALPEGTKAGGAYLTGYDVDLDGNTEFFLRNFVNSTFYILMVDIDSASVSEFPMPFNSPAVWAFGYFNLDIYPDALISNRNNADDFLTFDLMTNSTIGTFSAVNVYIPPIIGNFTGGPLDCIGVVGSGGYTITVVEADGSLVQTTTLDQTIKDMVEFDFLGGIDEIAIIESDGNLVVFNGNTLSVIYNKTVDPLTSYRSYIDTGDFNSDSNDDLVVISEDQEKAYFEDIFSGTSIHEVDGVYAYQSNQFGDVGKMDQDTIDDLAVGTTYGGLGVIRGADGSFANLQYLVDVSISSATQIISYDCVGNTRDDVVVRILDNVYIIISDIINPVLTPIPIDPVHPTVLDDYVTIEVHVSDTSVMDYVDIWMKLPGSVVWIQPQDEMYESHTDGVYYAFVGDLQPGEYNYYIVVRDSYLNMGELGNTTYPLTFTVAGDFVWQIDKTNNDLVHRRFHQSDMGNLSDGRAVIYTLERAEGEVDLTLTKYSRGGGVYDSLTIVEPDAKGFENFGLFTAMIDGDSIQDIIALDLRSDGVGGYIFRYHVYHGSNFTLMGSGIIPYDYKSFEFIGVFDDDGDGNEELFIASDTSPQSVIKMDSDLSWDAIELPQAGNNRYTVRGFTVVKGTPYGYIAVVRGDIQIDILTTDLVYSHSLDIDMSGFPNMDFAGIDTIYNATTDQEQFVTGFTYWNGSDATGRLFVFSESTTNVNNTPDYSLPYQYITYFYSANVFGDESDELFIKLPEELLLGELSTTLVVSWSTPITGAAPLSAMIADFDGDTDDEFLLFTDQDELLTQVSYEGVVEWTVEVGEIYNPLLLGNIDSIPGVEIAAYPISTVTSNIIGAIRNLDSHYIFDVGVEIGATEVIQGEPFDANVTVANVYGEIIEDASVYISAHFVTPEGPGANTFGLYFDWWSQKYWGITDATWPMGLVNVSVFVDHEFYHPYNQLLVNAVTVRSTLHVNIDAPPFVNQGDDMSIVVWVFDNLDGIVDDATVTITLDGVGQAATQTGPYYLVSYPEVDFDAGFHLASATANHPYALSTGSNDREIFVQLRASSLLVNTDFPVIVFQDEFVSAWFNITDQYGTPVSGATVSFVSGPRAFQLVESPIPGCYNFTHRANLALGNQSFELRINSPNVVENLVAEVQFDVIGDLELFVSFSPELPVQGQPMFISVIAVDGHGNPVPDLEVFVHFMNLPPMMALEGDQVGEYVAIVEHIPLTEGYGIIDVTVEAVGEFAVMSSTTVQVNIAPATPDFTLISTDVIGLGIGVSFFLSLFGMVLYFRMASSMSVDDKSEKGLKKAVRNIDRLYLVIVIACGLGLVSSYGMYQAGEYGLALVLTVALLGASVLLYGLWLYRDAMSAILVKRSLSRKRMILGLWHLVFVPVVIVLILQYGVEIDWFKAYIIDQSFMIGSLVVPTIMTTIFTAYLSSILVVVVNLYREVSKGLKKINKMEEAGTPIGIVEDEKTLMIGGFSSSIRIKFLMFLVVVGATTVMSMDFLASWELGIIILLPVVFLVVIPFISSKIIQVFSKVTRGKVPAAPVET